MNRRGGCQGQCDWTERDQFIIQSTRFVNGACLKGYLKTTTAHAKAHSIHVHKSLFEIGALFGTDERCLDGVDQGRVYEPLGCIDVLKDGQINGHLTTSSQSNVSGECGEPRMVIDDRVGQIERSCYIA